MPKAVISNRIYLDNPGPEITKNIIKALTYKIVGKYNTINKMAAIEIIKNYKALPNGIISMPQTRVDLIPEGYEIVDKRTTNEVPFPTPKYPLREAQQPVYDEVVDTCFINALVGWGKTFTALHLARKLGQKTLVITHTTNLRDQWVDEVEILYGMDCGIIGSGKFDTEDHAIVICNIQSLVKHIDRVVKEFGTIIVDECLDYEAQVTTLEKGKVKIGTVVNNKMPVHVLSLDPITGISSYKKVLNYYKTPHTECLKISHSGGGSLKCTKNHGIYTYSNGFIEKIPAEYLEVGDYLIQTAIDHKSTHIINNEWKSIALGLILGDGSLQYPHNHSDSVRIKVTHGQAQFEYLEWKKHLMGDTTECVGESGYKKGNLIKGVSTKSFYDIDNWHGQLYVDGHKKKITKKIANTMDKLSWALLFQDDGSAGQTSDSITFSVCELDEKSVQYLIDSLTDIFGISEAVQFVCSKGYRYLRLNKVDTLLFLRGINGLVHPQLWYKLNSIKNEIKEFDFPIPKVPLFNEHYCVRKITDIETSTLTGNHRFNIEVEDNHTYFANGLLVSNCHHIPATTFSTVIDKIHARYRIGLSGTMTRKDGKHILFNDYFGSKVIQPPASDTMVPTVKIINTGITLDPKASWTEKITKLVQNDDYVEFVSNVAKTQMLKGHSVLVIADRVEFLEKVHEQVGERSVLVTGSTTKEERDTAKAQLLSKEKLCVAGSRQIFSEGISINILSCVILAVPMSNDALLEQIVGRVMRQHEGKLNPLVIDMNFSGWADKKQNNDRLGLYLRKGWVIDTV